MQRILCLEWAAQKVFQWERTEDQSEPAHFNCCMFHERAKLEGFLNMSYSVYYICYNTHKIAHCILLPSHHSCSPSPQSQKGKKAYFPLLWLCAHQHCFNLLHSWGLRLADFKPFPLGYYKHTWRSGMCYIWGSLSHTLKPLRVSSSCYRQIFVCTWAASHLRTSLSEVWGSA